MLLYVPSATDCVVSDLCFAKSEQRLMVLEQAGGELSDRQVAVLL